MKNSKKAMHKLYERLAKTACKSKEVKDALLDIKQHFKTDNWPLSFEVYKALSGVKDTSIFLTILRNKGYKVKATNYNLVIVESKK